MPLSMFKQWIDKTGIELAPGVSPIATKDRGLALSAEEKSQIIGGNSSDRDGLDGESLVVRVPSEVVLNAQRINELAVDDLTLQQWIEVDDCSGSSLLHRGLLYLWLVKKDSLWKDYLDILPKEATLPFSCSIEDMEGLDFSAVSLHHAALMKRLAIEKAYERFAKSEVGRSSGITLNQWLIPHNWISSRGLTHPFTAETCLVPAIDLCNHSSKNSNVRYDIDEEGDFELRVLPDSVISKSELCLDYGTRSTGEFVFNYGFVPEDRTESDFDEVFKVFDPGDEEIRDVLDPSRYLENIDEDAKIEMSLSYDVLLELFSEDIPQVLRIVRLPKDAEADESKRYRFQNNFIMALACYDHFELRSNSNKEEALFLGDQEVVPESTFEMVLAYGDPKVVEKAKAIVVELCALFSRQLSAVPKDDSMISQLIRSEASIYEQYSKINTGV